MVWGIGDIWISRYDTKLVPNEHEWPPLSLSINLVSFETFICPLFRQICFLVWTFFHVSYSKPALDGHRQHFRCPFFYWFSCQCPLMNYLDYIVFTQSFNTLQELLVFLEGAIKLTAIWSLTDSLARLYLLDIYKQYFPDFQNLLTESINQFWC